MTFLSVIIARGGANGKQEFENKNLQLLAGKPLIWHRISAEQQSGVFNRIIVSTDSVTIAKTVREYGIEVPFMRPKEFATKTSHSSDAVTHALKWIEGQSKRYDYVSVVQPTSPLVTPKDVRACRDMILDGDLDAVISVTPTEVPREWAFHLPDDKSMTNWSGAYATNRQMFPQSYKLTGAVRIAKWDVWLNRKSYYEMNTKAYVMPRERSIDIDTYLDFKLAQALLGDNGCPSTFSADYGGGKLYIEHGLIRRSF